MSQFAVAVKKFVKEEDAPTMVEYGLLVAVIAIVVVAGAIMVGNNTNTLFEDVAGIVSDPQSASGGN
jgi:pilus assembly protein Flp/PilA